MMSTEATGTAQSLLHAPWVAAIVVLGLAILAYLLPIVAVALENRPQQ